MILIRAYQLSIPALEGIIHVIDSYGRYSRLGLLKDRDRIDTLRQVTYSVALVQFSHRFHRPAKSIMI